MLQDVVDFAVFSIAILLEAKFHYVSWFGDGSNQLRTSSEPAPKQLRTGSEPDSLMEFGREPASLC